MRDELWERAVKTSRGRGTVIQVWTANNPQGFLYRQSGENGRVLEDFDGLVLVSVTNMGLDVPQNADTTEG